MHQGCAQLTDEGLRNPDLSRTFLDADRYLVFTGQVRGANHQA